MASELAVKAERGVLYCALAFGVGAGVAELLGLSDWAWLQSRLGAFTLIVLSFLTLHVLLSSNRTERITDQLVQDLQSVRESLERLSFQDEVTSQMSELWAAREPAIGSFLDRMRALDRAKKDRSAILSEVAEALTALRAGELEGRGQRFPWDASIVVIDNTTQTFAFHPSEAMVGKAVLPRFSSNFDWLMDQARSTNDGSRIVLTRRTSEQLLGLVRDETWSAMRFSKVYFRVLPRLKLIVVVESHLSIVHQLPKGTFQAHTTT